MNDLSQSILDVVKEFKRQETTEKLIDEWGLEDRRRDLVRAGALIIAEIERLDCAAEPAKGGET